ncbi:MAG: hypothetical protein IPH59_01375 [bacterium]|nr:hypothetical protein [bacterium]
MAGNKLLQTKLKTIMRLSLLSESEEAQLWPLIQSKIGVDRLDSSASQRLSGVQSAESSKRGWKQTAVTAILMVALVAYVLWRLTHLE